MVQRLYSMSRAYAVAGAVGLPCVVRRRPRRRVAGPRPVGAAGRDVRRTAGDPRPKGEANEERNPLHFQRRAISPHTRLIVIQVLAALGAIVVGAQLFVKQIEFVAASFGFPPLILALVIAPLATELPEKFNSVIWVRQKKDTLAMGNISGAMVFQSCIPVTVGLWFTPWVLNEFAIASAVVAILAGLLMQVYLRSDNVLSGRELTSLGILYAGFIVYVVAFPHGSLPIQ